MPMVPATLWLTGCLSIAAGRRIPSSAYHQTMTAHPGDDVPLICVGPTVGSIIAVEVIKRDLEGGYFFCYKDGRPDVENQHPSYKDRVKLVDPQMKNNNVSVIIKNVTLNDSGVYECHFVTNSREKDANGNGSFGTNSSYNINMKVSETAGGEEEGSDLGNKDEGNRNQHIGLIASAVGLLFILVVFLCYCAKPNSC